MFLSHQMKRNLIITNKNGKYELTDEFSKQRNTKENLKLHVIIVQCPVFFPKMKILSILARNY